MPTVAVAAWMMGVLSASDAPVGWRMEVTPTRQVEAVLTYDFESPQMVVKEWMLISPKAPELPGQPKMTTTTEPAGTAGVEPVGKRPVMKTRVTVTATAGDPKKIVLRVIYAGTLTTRRLVPLAPGETAPKVDPLSAAEKKTYTSPDACADFQAPAFKKWLAGTPLKRSDGEDAVLFARRVCERIGADHKYEYRAEADRKASYVSGVSKSDCAGLSSLFVAVMRANGIPARTLVGRLLDPQKPPDTLKGQHVKAEFHVEGVGWVPLDPTNWVGERGGPKSPEAFGSDLASLLVMHVDSNMAADAGRLGKSNILFFQTPSVSVSGNGTFAGVVYKIDWKVTNIVPEGKDAKKAE